MPCALLSSSSRTSSADQLRPCASGTVSSRSSGGDRLGRALRLPREHVDLVIMRRVQRRGGRATAPRRCWRRSSDGRSSASSMSAIRSGAAHMPLPICALPDKPAGEADLDVAVLIGRDPVARLHLALADHRPGPHRGVHLVAGAVEEAGVDEDDAVLHRCDAGGEVGRGAPLLVHHADLDRVAGEAEQVLDRVEQPVGERRLVGPVHLGLDDIDRSGAAVAEAAVRRSGRAARSGW